MDQPEVEPSSPLFVPLSVFDSPLLVLFSVFDSPLLVLFSVFDSPLPALFSVFDNPLLVLFSVFDNPLLVPPSVFDNPLLVPGPDPAPDAGAGYGLDKDGGTGDVAGCGGVLAPPAPAEGDGGTVCVPIVLPAVGDAWDGTATTGRTGTGGRAAAPDSMSAVPTATATAPVATAICGT